MDEFKELLAEYKNITIEIYDCLCKDNFDELNAQLDIRNIIINKIKDIQYDKEHFQKICKELDILSLEDKINTVMKKKRLELQNNIKNIASGINANNSYSKLGYTSSYFFNKKI